MNTSLHNSGDPRQNIRQNILTGFGIIDIEKGSAYGGRSAQEGEVRTYGGKDYKKTNGKWVHIAGKKHNVPGKDESTGHGSAKDQISNLKKYESLKKEYDSLTNSNNHTEAALLLVREFGTGEEIDKIQTIQNNSQQGISENDQKERDSIANKYYQKIVGSKDNSQKNSTFGLDQKDFNALLDASNRKKVQVNDRDIAIIKNKFPNLSDEDAKNVILILKSPARNTFTSFDVYSHLSKEKGNSTYNSEQVKVSKEVSDKIPEYKKEANKGKGDDEKVGVEKNNWNKAQAKAYAEGASDEEIADLGLTKEQHEEKANDYKKQALEKRSGAPHLYTENMNSAKYHNYLADKLGSGSELTYQDHLDAMSDSNKNSNKFSGFKINGKNYKKHNTDGDPSSSSMESWME